MPDELIRTDLTELRAEMRQVRTKLEEVHIKVSSMPTCPAPGLCVRLDSIIGDHEKRMRSLERRDAYVVGACAIVSFFSPWVAKLLFKI